MPNTREKLIELLSQVQDYGTKNTCEEWSVTVECKDNETVADHLIANGVTVQQWIPVTERLPEEWNEVLVYIPHIDVMTFAKLRGGSWYATWDSMKLDHVSHWMPLPQPPKGE
jgi:hypothetical protein